MGQNPEAEEHSSKEPALHCGNGLYIVLATPAIAIRFRIIIGKGGTIKKLHLTTYKPANSSSPSSGVADLDVKVNEMSNPAIAFNSPCKTAAGWALVPPINQNCSFRHQSLSAIPDHLSSKIASKNQVMVITNKRTRMVTLSDWTMNWPEKREIAGRKQ